MSGRVKVVSQSEKSFQNVNQSEEVLQTRKCNSHVVLVGMESRTDVSSSCREFLHFIYYTLPPPVSCWIANQFFLLTKIVFTFSYDYNSS